MGLESHAGDGKKSLALLYFPALAEELTYLQPNSGTTMVIHAPIDTSLGYVSVCLWPGPAVL